MKGVRLIAKKLVWEMLVNRKEKLLIVSSDESEADKLIEAIDDEIKDLPDYIKKRVNVDKLTKASEII